MRRRRKMRRGKFKERKVGGGEKTFARRLGGWGKDEGGWNKRELGPLAERGGGRGIGIGREREGGG